MRDFSPDSHYGTTEQLKELVDSCHALGMRAVIILNLTGNRLENYTINNFPENGEWHEWAKDYNLSIEESKLTISLEPREALIFVKR